MSIELRRGADLRLERHLLFFSLLLAVGCLAYIPTSPDGIVPAIPGVTVPLAISLGLVVFTVRVHPRRGESAQVEHIVQYSWIGLLAAAAFGVVWLGIHLVVGLPIGGVVDEILTVVAVAVAAGVVVGVSRDRTEDGELPTGAGNQSRQAGHPPDRARVVEESFWTGRDSETAIFEVVVETLAEAQGVEPTEVGPVYEYINPDVFTELHRQQGAQWQLVFYTDRHEVRVSSQGTVTVYDQPGQ